MNIFRRRQSLEPVTSHVTEPTDSGDLVSEPIAEKEYRFEDAHEAGKYVLDLLAEKDAILKDFYEQGRSHGMSDDEISSAAQDAIKAGKLPAVAERKMPSRDGLRPIFLIDALPQQLIDTVSVVMREDRIKVSVRDFHAESLERIKKGQLAALNPERSSLPTLRNSPSDWQRVVGDLESEIRRPF